MIARWAAPDKLAAMPLTELEETHVSVAQQLDAVEDARTRADLIETRGVLHDEIDRRHATRADLMSRRREYNPNSDKPPCQGGPRWYR